MNPELQKSMQVTALSTTLDGHMLIILLIMLLAGVLGGVANYFLSDRPERMRDGRDWARYPVLGVISALTVPLFLNMLSTHLLEAPRTRPVDFFVFAGFCLCYVVASRRLFENVANRLLGQVDQVRREVAALKQARSEAVPVAEPSAASETSNGRTEATKETLAYNDVEILRALAAEPYVYGNLAGLTEKTGLARETVSSRLALLKSLGIIETRINDKNILHWCVSPRGKQLLGEILSGQEERT